MVSFGGWGLHDGTGVAPSAARHYCTYILVQNGHVGKPARSSRYPPHEAIL
jgi:hypothetical protein